MSPQVGGLFHGSCEVFEIVPADALYNQKPAIQFAAIRSLVGVPWIDAAALASAEGTTIIGGACLDRQLALQHEEMVRNLAVGVPRNAFGASCTHPSSSGARNIATQLAFAVISESGFGGNPINAVGSETVMRHPPSRGGRRSRYRLTARGFKYVLVLTPIRAIRE